VKKRAVRKADRLAAEDRVADFLTGQHECVADYRRADPQRFEPGARLILIGDDTIPSQRDEQFHRQLPQMLTLAPQKCLSNTNLRENGSFEAFLFFQKSIDEMTFSIEVVLKIAD
jgi:hypothetical protein